MLVRLDYTDHLVSGVQDLSMLFEVLVRVILWVLTIVIVRAGFKVGFNIMIIFMRYISVSVKGRNVAIVG